MKPLISFVFVLLVLAIAASTGTAAEPTSIPLKAQETRLEMLSDKDGALHFRLELGPLTAETVSTKGGDFTRLLIPGGHTSKTEGAPLLPMVNELIEIPYGAEAKVEILASSGRDISLTDLGFTKPLIPAQPSLSKSADPATVLFVHDHAAYMADKVAAPLAVVKSCGRLRGVDIGRLEISPVTYLPGQGTINVKETMEIRISFQGGDPEAGLELKDRTDSHFFMPLYDQIVGLPGLHDSYPDLVRDVVTLVVVTPPAFADQLTDFMDWKTRRGFHTIMAVTGTAEVGTTNTEIRDYIHGLYNNATPELPAPSFVIFVGDVAQMPTWYVEDYVTDRPYCAVDGDLVPDIFYGRFSATTASELQAILDKTLMYDQYAMPDPSYLHEVTMIAGVDGDFAPVWGNGQINYGTENYFNADHDIFSNTYLYPESGSSEASIIQTVSDGVSYINYTAHGGVTEWYDPSFGIGDINSLNNSGKYCLAVGNCCITSSFGFPECFAEAWLRAPDKGAIGYIGGSSYTNWDEDYWWGVGSGTVTLNPTYATSGLGAYDGLFHDHGEDMDQWYVTNDAIIFSGNLAVMEAGAYLTTYYWNIYNLMGDPSLSTWIGTPGLNTVSHPAGIFFSSASMTVQAQPGSYCGLSQDGQLLGAGSVDETGILEMGILNQPTFGQAELIVMGQNLEPYTALIDVTPPTVITFDPAEIDAGVETVVTVGVYDEDGITPLSGVEIWAEGVGYTSGVSVTGEDGFGQLTINYPYGPSIDVCGQDPVLTWLRFREPLAVNALLQEDVALRVTTDIGLDDVFPMNLPGTLEAYSILGGDLPDHQLWSYLNEEPGQMTTGDSMVLIPENPGQVRGVFAQIGHDTVEVIFPVQEVFGTLSGHVDAAGTPAAGAVVVGRYPNQVLAFAAVCDQDGNYAVPDDILVAEYQISVELFGYAPFAQTLFINYGANVLDIDLVLTPYGGVSGSVRELSTNMPLAAVIKFYREDTGEFFAEVRSDRSTGNYSLGSLPYYSYTVTARAVGHVVQSATVLVGAEVQVQDFLLERTLAHVLLINDSAKSDVREPKVGPDGQILVPATGVEAKSDAALVADLESLGYTVQVDAMGSDPATWSDYDLLITCSSNNITTFEDSQFRLNLQDYVQNGGRLLVEGGEVGFDWTYSDPGWAQTVLHASDCLGDFGGFIWVLDPDHPVMGYPNHLNFVINMIYYDYGDMDILEATPDARIVGSWTNNMDAASVIAYNADGTPGDGDFVFFSFCYDNADPALRLQLLDNAVTWLTGNVVTPVPDGLPQPPAKLALRANYPNPFNPQTTISFDLPRPGMVELTVFDVKGRRVVTLIEEEMPAGRHEAIWRGFDHNGAPVASGVYFLLLDAESKLLTSKMLLLK